MSMREVIFRLKLEADPANRKAADDALAQTNRLQSALQQTRKIHSDSQKDEEKRYAELAKLHLAQMSREKQYTEEDARNKRQLEKQNQQLAKATIQAEKEVRREREEAAREAIKHQRDIEQATERAAQLQQRANRAVVGTLVGRGGILHGVTSVVLGFKHLGLAAEGDMQKLIQGMERLHGIEYILRGSLRSIMALSKAWQAVSASASAAGMSMLGAVSKFALPAAAIGAVAGVGIEAKEIFEGNSGGRKGGVEAGGRGGLVGWVQRNVYGDNTAAGRAGREEYQTATRVENMEKAQKGFEEFRQQQRHQLELEKQAADEQERFEQKRSDLRKRLAFGREQTPEEQLRDTGEEITRQRGISTGAGQRQTSLQADINRFTDSGKLGGPALEAVKQASDQGIAAEERILTLVEKEAEVKLKMNREAIESAKRQVELTVQQGTELNKQYEESRKQRLSAAERFLEDDPVKRARLIQAATRLKGGQNLTRQQIKSLQPYDSILGPDLQRKRESLIESELDKVKGADVLFGDAKEKEIRLKHEIEIKSEGTFAALGKQFDEIFKGGKLEKLVREGMTKQVKIIEQKLNEQKDLSDQLRGRDDHAVAAGGGHGHE